MIVNTKSWHYHLVSTYGPRLWDARDMYPDSCSYIKGVIKTAFWLALMVLLGGLVLALTVGDTIAWLVACAVAQTWIAANGGLWVLGGVIVILIVLVGVGTLKEYVQNHVPRHAKVLGFVSQAYDRVHNKFCSSMEYRSED